MGSLFARGAAGQSLDGVFRVQVQASLWSQVTLGCLAGIKKVITWLGCPVSPLWLRSEG